MTNLGQRVITGAIGASIVFGCLLFSEVSFILLLLFISIISLLEFYRLSENDGIAPQKVPAILTSVFIFLPPILDRLFQASINLFYITLLFPFLIFIRELYTASTKPFTNIAYTLLGLIYISVPLFLFYLISFHGSVSYQPWTIIGYFFILWSSDTGAYFAGKYAGKHKLFERISPKKTWEGFFGGMILAVTVALLISKYNSILTPLQWVMMALIILITGTLGDLVESMFKRSIQIKDSGSILPGHGGFLDRFDGLFISSPFVFVYLQLI